MRLIHLTIERKLNEPTVCQFRLSMPTSGDLAAPLRNQSVNVLGDDGTQYFTGYVASNPVPEYAGLALEGPRYRFAICAISDELLMDQLPPTSIKTASGMTAGQLMTALVTHTRSATLDTKALSLQCAGEQLCRRTGRNLESERRTGSVSGASSISGRGRSSATRRDPNRRASAQRSRWHPKSCCPIVYLQHQARTRKRYHRVRRTRTGCIRD